MKGPLANLSQKARRLRCIPVWDAKRAPLKIRRFVAMPFAPSSVLVTTSKAPVTTSVALVPNSFLLLLVRHLLLLAWHLLLEARRLTSCDF